MKTIKITAESRKTTGKQSTKRLRKEKKVPCVLYGEGENIHFAAPAKSFRHLVYSADTQIVELDIEGKEYKAVMQDLQFHPVSDDILHIDFYQITEQKKVTVSIPVQLEGFAKGVTEGGILHLAKRKLKVYGLYTDFPDRLYINIEELGIGDSFKVRDLEFENLELLDNRNSVVVAVRRTRIATGQLPEPEEGEEEAEEGEEAAAEGEEAEKEAPKE